MEVMDRHGYYVETHDGQGSTISRGQFNLTLDITALLGTVYIPASIASGKKPTGFVYEIEGTGEGNIFTTSFKCSGVEVTQVMLGTLRYIKIPQGQTAKIEMIIIIDGRWGDSYRILITRVNYKLSPTDARYKKFDTSIISSELAFK